MTEKQRKAFRSPATLASAWEQQKLQVKQEMAAASAANDAKTIRLRALRLERERQEADIAAASPAPKPAPKRARAKRVAE